MQNNRTANIFDSAMEQVKGEVDGRLSSSPWIIRSYTKHLALSTGKLIRASAVLVCAQKDDGTIPEKAVKLAAAIEILHLATLVHDDIMDDADIRRGEATLQKKYGKKTAVICGDYLLCMALKLTASLWDQSETDEYIDLQIPDYLSRVCLGELNQHVNNGNLDLSIHQYLKIISGKTAALFEASFFAGATFATKEPQTLKKFGKLGRNIGMIFQLMDDCSDFEETKEAMKKPVQSDYEQNVITLPLIHAFKNSPELKERAKKEKLSRTVVNKAVLDTGGLSFTRLVAEGYYNKALQLIIKMDLTTEKALQLKKILDRSFRVI